MGIFSQPQMSAPPPPPLPPAANPPTFASSAVQATQKPARTTRLDYGGGGVPDLGKPGAVTSPAEKKQLLGV